MLDFRSDFRPQFPAEIANSASTSTQVRPTSSTSSNSLSRTLTVDIRNYQIPENRSVTPDLGSSPAIKRFLMKRKNGNQISLESSITIDERFLRSVFEISKKYHIEKEVKNIVLYYPISDLNRNVKEIAVENDEYAEENLETFYTQTPEM